MQAVVWNVNKILRRGGGGAGGVGPWDVERDVWGGEGGGHPAEDVGEAGKRQQSEWSKPLLEEPADNTDQWGENVVQADWNYKTILQNTQHPVLVINYIELIIKNNKSVFVSFL